MFDLRYIRDNPSDFDAAMVRRGLDAQSPAILKLDEERRMLTDGIYRERVRRTLLDPSQKTLTLERARALRAGVREEGL